MRAGAETGSETWIFDRIDRIGGHPTTVLGNPHVIDSPEGKAVEFNGRDDGLQLDVHPLEGAATYTWEAIFRPDGGDPEQRWFHLEENPATGSDSDSRMLFEIRVIGDRWCLDAFNRSGSVQKALLDRKSLHTLGAWHRVAAVYDGTEFRSYVDGILDGENLPDATSSRTHVHRSAHQQSILFQRRHPPGALYQSRACALGVCETVW
jgi:hypothetical protein